MIVHVPSSAAAELSEALWALARPPQVRGVDDTTHLFPWLTATDGSRWLVVETGFSIPVHAAADLGGVADILSPWVGHGITQGDIEALAGVVEGHRGGRMTPWDFFPELFQGLSKTREEMIDEGLLAAVEGGGA